MRIAVLASLVLALASVSSHAAERRCGGYLYSLRGVAAVFGDAMVAKLLAVQEKPNFSFKLPDEVEDAIRDGRIPSVRLEGVGPTGANDVIDVDLDAYTFRFSEITDSKAIRLTRPISGYTLAETERKYGGNELGPYWLMFELARMSCQSTLDEHFDRLEAILGKKGEHRPSELFIPISYFLDFYGPNFFLDFDEIRARMRHATERLR